MENKVNLAFLFHMHQPVYRLTPFDKKQTGSAEYILPWVRLHATKDYYDFVAVLDNFPKIKININIVPSLLIQLEEYARGIALDKHLEITLKPSSQLTPEDKAYILNEFFLGYPETMIKPYQRYNQLFEIKNKLQGNRKGNLVYAFSKQDFLDLQVWSNLSWMDPYWRKTDPFIDYLFRKQKKFTENDKLELVAKQRSICGMITKKYKELQDKGQLEITVSPFYHPILPLLCNTDIAKVSMPQVKLPRKFSYPEDASAQIIKAVQYYKKVFGKPPSGMWPSEAGVSEDILPLISDAGISWIATDEQILVNTLNKPGGSYQSMQSIDEILHFPYKIKTNSKFLNILFRDRTLSDAFSFYYHKIDVKSAIDQFFSRVYSIKNITESKNIANPLVSIMLDGENCWEYYKDDGWDLLTELYSRLSDDRNIVTTRVSDFLNKKPPSHTLKNLFPGSWESANFKIWIGHPEDNRAWELTLNAKNMLKSYLSRNPKKKNTPEVKKALEELYIAEGSDWFWWFGDENYSAQSNLFDLAFRTHLINIYKLLSRTVPDELYNPIKGRF